MKINQNFKTSNIIYFNIQFKYKTMEFYTLENLNEIKQKENDEIANTKFRFVYRKSSKLQLDKETRNKFKEAIKIHISTFKCSLLQKFENNLETKINTCNRKIQYHQDELINLNNLKILKDEIILARNVIISNIKL